MESPRSCKFFTSQFRKDKFLFRTDKPWKLGHAEGEGCQVLYIIYRLFWVLWWTGVFIYDIYDEDPRKKFPIYLTNWSYVGTAVSSYLQLICAICALTCYKDLKNDESAKMPIIYTVSWIVYSVWMTATVLVSLLYWGLIFEGKLVDAFVNVSTHVVNSFYAITDLLITGIPFRILHFWLPEIFGISFFLFSVIYWLASGDLIYKTIDFENSPGLAVGYFIGALIAVPIIHMLLFCVYWLRVLIFDSCECCGCNERLDRGSGNSQYNPELDQMA